MTAAVAAVIVLACLLLARPFDSKSSEITAGGGPVESSPAQLAALSATLHQPIYWAGAAPGKTLEAN